MHIYFYKHTIFLLYVYNILYTIYWIRYSIDYTLCVMYYVVYTIYNIPCIVYSILFTIHYILYRIYIYYKYTIYRIETE